MSKVHCAVNTCGGKARMACPCAVHEMWIDGCGDFGRVKSIDFAWHIFGPARIDGMIGNETWACYKAGVCILFLVADWRNRSLWL